MAAYECKLQSILCGSDLVSQAADTFYRKSMRRMCGVDLSHTDIVEVMTTAAIAISVCGKFVSDADERDAIIGLIGTSEKDRLP